MEKQHHNSSTTRREFFIRCSKAGLSAAAVCASGYLFYDSSGPKQSEAETGLVSLSDYAVPDKKGVMAVVKGEDRKKTLHLALKALGGIEAFVEKGDNVLLKVNAAFATPPALSATTNPVLVSELTRLCFKAGAKHVVVTDNPINDPPSCFALSGIEQAARREGAVIMLPERAFFHPTTLKDALLIREWPILFEPFKDIDKVIGIAPLKDHHRSGASMTMKNWYGILGGRRNVFHQDIHNIIKELAMMVRPSLVILDGTVSMMTNGPTGGSLSDLKPTNTMIVSTDQVAADAYGATLLGKTKNSLPFISKAEAKGLGTADYQSLNPIIL